MLKGGQPQAERKAAKDLYCKLGELDQKTILMPILFINLTFLCGHKFRPPIS
jgi:hypothetical protein